MSITDQFWQYAKEAATPFGSDQAIFIGQIVYGYAADQFVINAERALIDTPKLKLIGGMHGQKWYARLSDCFVMDRGAAK